MDTIQTRDILEYKNGHFATIHKIAHRGKHMGWYYEDTEGRKNWYQFFVKESKHPLCEGIVKELEWHNTCFGEDCIYTHGIYAAEKICNFIYNNNL